FVRRRQPAVLLDVSSSIRRYSRRASVPSSTRHSSRRAASPSSTRRLLAVPLQL
ncbi:hypothetical protein A2U01_0112036, partial [Trifolium medium]|nr:hypothetical protein [Trifolium medium]